MTAPPLLIKRCFRPFTAGQANDPESVTVPFRRMTAWHNRRIKQVVALPLHDARPSPQKRFGHSLWLHAYCSALHGCPQDLLVRMPCVPYAIPLALLSKTSFAAHTMPYSYGRPALSPIRHGLPSDLCLKGGGGGLAYT